MQIIPSQEIDSTKWDATVAANKNGLIYSTYDYLNAMADNWSGLIINDYETIIPLPWRKKWSIKYLYTPAFVQQLGFIGNPNINYDNVLKTLFGFVKYGDYLFNASDNPPEYLKTLVPKCNFTLDLSNSYDYIQDNYSKELVGYLKKARKNNLTINDTTIFLAVDTYQQLYQERFSSFKVADYQHFKNLCIELERGNKAFAKQVVDEEGNILAIGLFLKDNKRIYNLMPSTYPLGRKLFAMHYMLDTIFQTYSSKSLVFDFEGSDHPGIKQFYQLFGSTNESYFHWHFNHLPHIIRAIKK